MIILKNLHTKAHKQRSKSARKSGFTLIELSIVLVIIGLIVGGVLTGQDLIKAAQVRATVSQYEGYNTAVNTFQTKYNGLPGDLIAATASQFGLTYGAGTAGLGDGDGMIADNSGTAGVEGGLFWVHLSAANLIGNNFTLATGTATDYAGAASTAEVLPLAKITGNYFWVSSSGGLNYYGLSGVTSFLETTGPAVTSQGQLTPIQAYNIDLKIDDGAPNTGIVQAIGASVSGALTLTTAASTISCISASGSAGTYVTNVTTVGNTPSCSLRMRFN